MNINPVHDIPQGSIILPGVGMTSVDELAASRAVEEYDPSLILGHRRDVNEWVVFVKDGPDGPFPVYGLGSRLPSPDEIQKKLYQSDVRRHGHKVVDAVIRENERKRLAARAEADAKIGEAAEHLAFGHNQQTGNTNTRIFVPGGNS